jgi:hypothetical protein
LKAFKYVPFSVMWYCFGNNNEWWKEQWKWKTLGSPTVGDYENGNLTSRFNGKSPSIYSYFHKKMQREFWEAYFQRNILDSLKPIRAKFLTFSYR